jgi:hypothetical protein
VNRLLHPQEFLVILHAQSEPASLREREREREREHHDPCTVQLSSCLEWLSGGLPPNLALHYIRIMNHTVWRGGLLRAFDDVLKLGCIYLLHSGQAANQG